MYDMFTVYEGASSKVTQKENLHDALSWTHVGTPATLCLLTRDLYDARAMHDMHNSRGARTDVSMM